MPLFTDQKGSFMIIEKIEDLLRDLKSKISKNECSKCGVGLVEEKGPGDCYYPPPYTYTTAQNPKETGKQTEKEIIDKKRQRSCETKISYGKTATEYIQQLEEEKTFLNNNCQRLKEENENNSAVISELRETLSENENDIAICREQLMKYKEDVGNLRDTIAEKEDKIQTLNDTAKNIEKERAELQQIINSKEKEEKYRNTKLEELRKLIDKHAASDKEKESQIQKLNRIIEDTKNTLENHQRENSELRKSNHQHKSSLAVKERELSQLEERCRKLEVQIEKNSRKEICVGFHTTLAPTMSSLILDGLMKELTDRLAVEKVDLVRRPFYGNTDFNFPLLAICVNVSRIGTDAKEVLKGIPKANNSKDVALLVFHHKEVHALPSQTSDKILTGTDFSHLGTIIDFAFLSQRGIYECDMNMMGIERIASFLLQYKTKKN
ncbi:paramyosin-like [Saccostrea echinata]|uniref:paramyosin-like n=1 Tax=Saccostrea echinata TaxID=191078 RepID=UPI002A82E729|nr:paramyosin-like [Saccostrea echinata]